MKGPLNALENMFWNAPQKVVCKAIVCAKEACGNRTAIPAGRRHGGREVAFKGETRKRGDKYFPAIGPAC